MLLGNGEQGHFDTEEHERGEQNSIHPLYETILREREETNQ